MAILLSAIKESKKSVDLKLETFREELKWSSSEASDRLERKLRANKPMEFRRKGNETQHAFNEELDQHLDEIEGELDSASRAESPLRKARKALSEGRKLLASRQKLAVDSDDEKKIHKVENKAEEVDRRVAGQKKAARDARRPTPYTRPGTSNMPGLPWGLGHRGRK